ncbi:MAG: Transcriptional regulator, PaaX family [Candidatus Amesbacteria bacterium GW2011_GWA2_47_70]|uniref:Transcriptional regulator, PaaX family n=1 Tax=Candidatus Amesbacteria bacterium GW2011_GWC2_45_19 TaxID=1618366 RepID=A0A0G1Q1G2_9BACT|nr:MAG: Transcriptional regulator, PaaX family [Candidatus Amesbacteria bacterium GW2011_GWC2_45_19]KKU69024.1 MAG: Transcriptional regulator, PaaX family [Microgenomates group bacterium GW2011_GWC1_47_20]KKU80011.1 MAG: Transcriptional regulator, PaaX family [Candidatus Amesbacteria bacterium GW2011_GWA2_47_70]
MKQRITARGLLKLVGDVGAFVLPLDKMAPYRWLHGEIPIKGLDDYFPSVVKQVASRLERRGLVKKLETKDGLVIEITNGGKCEALKYKLEDMKLKRGKWDGLWRLVFFDILEKDKAKRDTLREFLKKMGMEQMQDSVYVSPYDISGEVKYLREVLEIPHDVKLGVLKEIENEEELKEIFDL